MKNNLVRTITALVISLTGVFLSYYFLSPDNGLKRSSLKRIEMAKVVNVMNDVKKQMDGRIIWEPISKGDILYMGDKIKTAPLSSSKIQFMDNGPIIDIEPDSQIIVSKNNQKLSLQVVEGSLFVSSTKEDANLSVTSGDKPENLMNINNGDFSYSVNKEGKANVEVLKGTVDASNALIAHSSQKFKDLKPANDDNLFVDAKSDEGSNYNWTPLTDEYTVKLEIGSGRNNLKTIENTVVEYDKGVLKSKAIIGTYYWKLTAQNKKDPTDNFSSNTFKVTYKQKIAPLALYPITNDTVQLHDENSALEFKWSIMHSFESIKLEIFKEENPSSPFISERVESQTFFSTNKVSRAGKYSWNLVGRVSGSGESLVSPLQKFQIIVGDELQSPMPLLPEDKSIIYNSDKKIHDLHLSWKPVKEATDYLLSIKNHLGLTTTKTTKDNQFVITSLDNGTYFWSVQSINIKKEKSKTIISRSFSIEPMATLKFKNQETKIFYINQFPSYDFSWNVIPDTSSYRLKISQSQTMSPNELMRAKEEHFSYQIGKEGLYYAQVEALNKQEDVMAQSNVFSFSVAKSPLPPAPIFLNNKNSMEANSNGDISFEFTNYDKKFNVLFEIRDLHGIMVEQTKSNSPLTVFKSLSPGTFVVTAKYEDQYNQRGEVSARNTFLVPDKSSIAAPKPKGIKVR